MITEFYITIVDDTGCDRNFPVENFTTLAKYRDKQIEEILK